MSLKGKEFWFFMEKFLFTNGISPDIRERFLN